jgi:hypothetical protein
VLKIEVTFSSETSVDFQWAIRHYIPKDRTRFTAILNIRETPGPVQGNFFALDLLFKQIGHPLKKNNFAEELMMPTAVCIRRLAEITY